MNIFNLIPIGFFNPLASGSNNRIYADCLQVIYDEYDREITFRMERDRIRDAIAIYLMENHIDVVSDIDDYSLNQKVPDEKAASSSYLDLASQIIRKLSSDEVGWLEEEIDDATFGRNIIMTEQGIMLAELLARLEKPETAEFSSYIYNIYNTLSNIEQYDDIYVDVLKNVYKNAKGLSKDLKTLATFIKKIIERMVHEETFESLTENLLDYFNGDFIKEYSRLTKRQNIRTYRRVILQRLNNLKIEETKEKLVICCKKEQKISDDKAEECVDDMIDNTVRFLDGDYDRIMSNIKHKINVYLQVAVGRARFIRNKEKNIRGDIEKTLKILGDEMKELDIHDSIPDEMKSLFTFDDNQFIDLSSISYPRRSQIIRENSTQDLVEIDEEDIERTRSEFEKELEDIYAKDKMSEYLNSIIGERLKIDTRDFPLENKVQLLKMLSSAVYAEESGYIIEVEDGYIETDQMLIRKFSMKRK